MCTGCLGEFTKHIISTIHDFSVMSSPFESIAKQIAWCSHISSKCVARRGGNANPKNTRSNLIGNDSAADTVQDVPLLDKQNDVSRSDRRHN